MFLAMLLAVLLAMLFAMPVSPAMLLAMSLAMRVAMPLAMLLATLAAMPVASYLAAKARAAIYPEVLVRPCPHHAVEVTGRADLACAEGDRPSAIGTTRERCFDAWPHSSTT